MTFTADLNITNSMAKITLSGELDAKTAPLFKEQIEKAATANVGALILFMKDLTYMASAGLRFLIFAKQKMGAKVNIYLISPQEMVLDTIEKTGFNHSVIILDEAEYSAAKL